MSDWRIKIRTPSAQGMNEQILTFSEKKAKWFILAWMDDNTGNEASEIILWKAMNKDDLLEHGYSDYQSDRK